MIKGDLRKKQILETAERLFTEHGYERTGVQDILDVLNLSKGSFYHHFASKELVLLTICESRAELSAAHYRAEETENGLERMNRLLSGMIPFQGEGLAFLKMLMPVFLLPEGKSVLNGYQEALKSAWLPMTIKALEQMINQKAAFARFPEKLAGILLDLINDLWGRISQEMLSSSEKENTEIAGNLIGLVEAYRAAVENIICAPYGTIELINLEQLIKTSQELHEEKKRR
ncbi:MAG: TetR/AcrR family transcriptional regulator [Clostridia bacterium]|nr:TetR/AcrR family transcriptional regulator [Clostridia bacterium]